MAAITHGSQVATWNSRFETGNPQLATTGKRVRERSSRGRKWSDFIGFIGVANEWVDYTLYCAALCERLLSSVAFIAINMSYKL